MASSSTTTFDQWLSDSHGAGPDGCRTDLVDQVLVPHHIQSLLFQISACYGQLAAMDSTGTGSASSEGSSFLATEDERKKLLRQAEDLFDRLAAMTAQCERVACE